MIDYIISYKKQIWINLELYFETYEFSNFLEYFGIFLNFFGFILNLFIFKIKIFFYFSR